MGSRFRVDCLGYWDWEGEVEWSIHEERCHFTVYFFACYWGFFLNLYFLMRWGVVVEGTAPAFQHNSLSVLVSFVFLDLSIFLSLGSHVFPFVF